ncbi:25758_t:CDS:2 [Gigaspora rosea]|nr:25758_t:CDS:2 [Gigaspora rosea]
MLKECYRMMTEIKDDSIDGIFKTLHDVAMISKNDGGIGVDITDIRPSGDCIKVSGGISSGVGMMLRVFNETMKYVDQGGNKCRGAMMVNMAIWHLDISDFLRIRHHSRVAELRAANLHHCITIPDIFMRRVHANGDWTMFSPRDAEILLGKKLNGLYSDEFETGYLKCERLKNRKTIKAQIESEKPGIDHDPESVHRDYRTIEWHDDEAACDLNKRIFAMIYYAALEESCDLAMVNGPYDGYSGSPVSKGILHCDSWGVELDKQLDWASLRNRIKRYGIRNSLLVGPMPTASTSQCVKMGFSEGLFPDESNITLCETTRQIQENRGGVQNIESFPEDMMRVYRTTFEYDYDVIIDQAIDCAPYIDQSQSMNNYVASENPDAMIKQLFNSHQRAWGGGLKRLYYMKSMSVSRPLNLKVDDMQRYASRKICNEEGQCDSCAFSKEYDAKCAKKNHKQFGFILAFVYDKRMNKFIFESCGNNNSQYQSLVSPIGGKREMYFEVSRKDMIDLKLSDHTLLTLDGKEIEKALKTPDGFDISVEVGLGTACATHTDGKSSDELYIINKPRQKMVFTQKCIFTVMKREIFEIFETDGIITHVFLIVFDSYDFIAYSKEKAKGNIVVAMDPKEIIEIIQNDKLGDTKYFTPTIVNVFETVRVCCRPIKHEIVLFGGPGSGLSEA